MQLYPHLAQCAQPTDPILILFADSPALSVDTLRHLIEQAKQHALVLLTIVLSNPSGFGRIMRDSKNHITHIVEEKDADVAQKKVQEIFSGIMLVQFDVLSQFLPLLTQDNAQKEYYLIQLVALCYARHLSIGSCLTDHAFEARGVNDRAQLAALEREMQNQAAINLMQSGVSIVDPTRFDLRGQLHAEQDVRIDINCIFEGLVSIDRNSSIGGHCILKNTTIGKQVTIHPYSIIDGATIADYATVGPFARIRPGTVLEESVHIGNFVEVKQSTLGKGSKAAHLSYLGDAIIGAQVNIGAGTITCNYDGSKKHLTHIEDHAFIGSNTALVAPVTIGANATIGAGSTITKNAPADQLSLSRSKQTSLEWRRNK
jgi:bifunctional UDP-N-acetylglucosamine pyrophosphorylase/glucosamine-1-phosphate N-acetyltransferase